MFVSLLPRRDDRDVVKHAMEIRDVLYIMGYLCLDDKDGRRRMHSFLATTDLHAQVSPVVA